jgi:hypothetical protein
MMNNLEKARYFELLEKKKNGQLSYEENKEEFEELVRYATLVRDQVYYNQKKKYRLLIDDYLSGEASAMGFVWIFFGMYKQDAKDFELLTHDLKKLLSFQMESRSEGFSVCMEDIFGNCDSLAVDPDNIQSHEVNESEFKSYLEMIYSDMQKYFDK